MVGVCSDEIVSLHKSDTAMNHEERSVTLTFHFRYFDWLKPLLCSCESVRHCRWVDEIVKEAPWVIDQTFLDKWAIDYVAHDEAPYASGDHDDVYAYVKSQGQQYQKHMIIELYLQAWNT